MVLSAMNPRGCIFQTISHSQNQKNQWEWAYLDEYLGDKATTLAFFLEHEGEVFDYCGGDTVAIGEEG